MTTDGYGTVTPFDPTDFPLVDPYPPFSWVRPSDAAVAALLDADADDTLAVLADCLHVEDWAQVVTTSCGQHLCGDCYATHSCPTCDSELRGEW